jgi:TPR repeat protein
LDAKALFKKACDGSHVAGCSNLGLMEYENGNLAEARSLLNKACDAGSNLACKALIKINNTPSK